MTTNDRDQTTPALTLRDVAAGLGLVAVLFGLVMISLWWVLVAVGLVAVAWGVSGDEV